MRNRFEEQLSILNNELITMGSLCEEAISGAVRLLHCQEKEECYAMGERAETLPGRRKSKQIKEAVTEAEQQIDKKERTIETICMKLLMQQQPVASDLRAISSALKMISDMERIGDQAADIAEIAQYAAESGMESKTHIAEMAKATIRMVTDSVDSFVKKDVELAYRVIAQDNVVDALFDRVKEELIDAVRKKAENPEALLDLFMIAKYFERIGDHAENIAEWVIYSITGKHAEDNEDIY